MGYIYQERPGEFWRLVDDRGKVIVEKDTLKKVLHTAETLKAHCYDTFLWVEKITEE